MLTAPLLLQPDRLKPRGKHKVQESTQAISNDRIALLLMVGYQVIGDELWERTYRAILDESTWNNITKDDMSIEDSAHV